METKGITCKIPLDLHSRISEEMREKELTVSQYIELVIREHMDGGIHMGKTRTLAFQVSEELFQRIKDYLDRYEQTYRRKLTQKEFVIGLIEQALAEADEEFEAAKAAEAEDLADEVEDMDQEDEVTSDVESDEDAEPDDAPEGDAEADAALADCADADARYDDPAFGADAERAV